ncbi:membrane protein [Microlunatus spumicola]|uniref:Membrane protein n=1 Tax=Microlunatus spumicola TaxID=81499 RepID=A0ABP6WUQ0_9ACTN
MTSTSTVTPVASGSTDLAAKVPAITVLFWVVKTLTTGMGEALSDFLASTNLVAAIAIGVLGLAAALWLQLRTRRYTAPVYWLAVAMVAVFGTMAADGVHLVGLPYAVTTVFYLLVVGALFFWWHRSEGTLSIHSITTRRRELFYWATVLASFALGTAAGDLTADQLELGYLPSVAIFAVAIAVPAIGWRFFRLNPVVAFWVAYVLTRPLGASIADWLGKPASHGGGLGFGDGPVAGVAALLIAALVAWLAVRRTDVQAPVPETV